MFEITEKCRPAVELNKTRNRESILNAQESKLQTIFFRSLAGSRKNLLSTQRVANTDSFLFLGLTTAKVVERASFFLLHALLIRIFAAECNKRSITC